MHSDLTLLLYII